MLFQGNVTRSEVILIAANDGRSNLLEKSFLNSIWDMHMRILDLKITDEDDGDGLAAAAAVIAETGDTLELPKRRLQQQGQGLLFLGVSETEKDKSGHILQKEESSNVLPSPTRRLAWGDPVAAVQQHFVQQQLMQQQQQQQQYLMQQQQLQQPQRPMPGGGRRRREAMAAAAAAAEQQQQQLHQPFATPPEAEEVCDPERQLPRDRITGLGCRPPLAPGEFGFANLCAKDATGACDAPDGIIFLYGNKRYLSSSSLFESRVQRKCCLGAAHKK